MHLNDKAQYIMFESTSKDHVGLAESVACPPLAR